MGIDISPEARDKMASMLAVPEPEPITTAATETDTQSTAEDDAHVAPPPESPIKARFSEITAQRNFERTRRQELESRHEADQLAYEREKRAYERKLADAEARLAELEGRSTAESGDPVEQRFALMEQQLLSIAERDLGRDLDLQVAQAMSQYPDLNEKRLWLALAAQPTVPVADIAREMDEYELAVTEQRGKYFAQPAAPVLPSALAPAPMPPPRPKSTTSSSGPNAAINRPRTMEDARNATAEYLRTHPI